MFGWLRHWMGQLWSTPLIPYYEGILEVTKRKGNKKGEAQAYLNLGKAYEENGDPAEAKRCFNNALKIAKEQNDMEQQKNAYNGLISASVSCNEFQRAIEYLHKATEVELITSKNQLQDLIERLSTSDANKRCSTTVGDVETLHEKKDSKSQTGLGSAWFRLSVSEIASKSIQEARRNVKKESTNEAELLNITEETCNFTDAERLPTEDLASLEKHEEFSASNIYAVPASSEEPLTENDRKTMTENVKSLARKNLLSPSNEDSSSENDVKFVSADEQIYNLARDDLLKNKSTKIPAIKMQDLLSSYMGSVGQISCGEIRGTCFLVTDKVVITNYHVYRMFMDERQKNPALQLPITVTFDYFYHKQAENCVCVDVDERGDRLSACESGSLDYKFLSLRESEGLRGRVPLGPLVSGLPLAEDLVIILGHPAGREMFQETCVVGRSWEEIVKCRHDKLRATDVHIANIDSLDNMRKKHRGLLAYDTTLFCGSAGSPVFTLNGDIVAMHTQGYTLNFREGKCSLMEFGVQFNAICEDFRFRCGQNLLEQFFPNLNHESYNQQPAVCGNDDGQNKAIRLERTLHVFETKADNHLSRGTFYEKAIEPTEEAEKLAAKANNSEIKQKQFQEMDSWFKETFLDSKRKLKDEIHEELKSFPWFCGAYGLAAPNKKIPRLHLFLTVKRGKKKMDVRRDLEKKYKRDPKEYVELLQEPKRKPKIKYLGDRSNKASLKPSAPSPDPPVRPSPGGGVRACISDSHEVQGSGTLTLFCFYRGHHYALTCFHVGCANDEFGLNATFNKVENIQKIRSLLPIYVDEARRKKYLFAGGQAENNNEGIPFEDDGTNYARLGDFHSYRFDSECDILSLKISSDSQIDCRIDDIATQDWESIWDELIEKFANGTSPVEVGKLQLSPHSSNGHIHSCNISYGDEHEVFKNAIVVKGCNGPFLESGDSGSLVYFHKMKEPSALSPDPESTVSDPEKLPFAYGVFEVEELSLPQHGSDGTSSAGNNSDSSSSWDDDEGASENISLSEDEDELHTEAVGEGAKASKSQIECQKDNACESNAKYCDEEADNPGNSEIIFQDRPEDTGPYYICLRLDTALEKLGLDEAACVDNCAGQSRHNRNHER